MVFFRDQEGLHHESEADWIFNYLKAYRNDSLDLDCMCAKVPFELCGWNIVLKFFLSLAHNELIWEVFLQYYTLYHYWIHNCTHITFSIYITLICFILLWWHLFKSSLIYFFDYSEVVGALCRTHAFLLPVEPPPR